MANPTKSRQSFGSKKMKKGEEERVERGRRMGFGEKREN